VGEGEGARRRRRRGVDRRAMAGARVSVRMRSGMEEEGRARGRQGGERTRRVGEERAADSLFHRLCTVPICTKQSKIRSIDAALH